MRASLVVLLFGSIVALGCGKTVAVSPSPRMCTAPVPHGTFHFPSYFHAGPPVTQINSMIAIDGVVTGAPWPGNENQPPSVFDAGNGRLVLRDDYRDVLYIWEPSLRRRTELGRASLVGVPSLGQVIFRAAPGGQQGIEIVDIDPTQPALRPIRVVKDVGYFLGDFHGALAFTDNSVDKKTQLTFLAPGGDTTSCSPRFEGYGFAVERNPADAIRADRLLMLRHHQTDSRAEVALLDLETGTMGSVAAVETCPDHTSEWEGLGSRRVSVQWSSEPPLRMAWTYDRLPPPDCRYSIDPATNRLVR